MPGRHIFIRVGIYSGRFRSPAGSSNCDRQCLLGLIQNYLAALVNHGPKAVPFADAVKFTENTRIFWWGTTPG